jgi:hypothetical protein
MASNVNLYNQSRDTEAAAKDAQVRAIVAQALGDRPDFNSVPLGTLIDQFIGQVKLGAQGKMSESPTDLMTQGAANGIAAGIGTGGGKPPTPGAGGVMVEGAGQALNAVPGTPGYLVGYAILNTGSGGENGQQSPNSGASNAATYPSLKGQLSDENLANIAASDSRLATAISGSGKSNPNFTIGNGTAAETDQLGKVWVGDGAKMTNDGSGWISADGTRVYRMPSQKDSPFATTGMQANFETYTVNSITGQRTKIGNGHLNVTN